MEVSENVNPLNEVKILQRHKRCDLNVMLLYSLFVLKMKQNDDVERQKTQFEKDFINKCFYCGCTTGKSGVEISHFIIQRSSLVALFSKIKQKFPSKNKNYTINMVVGLLNILLNGLNSNEQILIYDSTRKSLTELSRENNLYDFVKSFQYLNLNNLLNTIIPLWEGDNLLVFYDAIKEKLNTDIKVYYTLYDNSIPATSGSLVFRPIQTTE